MLIIFNFDVVYADMENGECNTLDFQLGTTGIDAQLAQNRGWNIKVRFNCIHKSESNYYNESNTEFFIYQYPVSDHPN